MTAPPRLPLLAIVGATGTGKSALAVRLAHALGRAGRAAEVVSADAMQLYRGMDIGTAKVTPAEQAGVPHHLLDVLDPHQEATVAAYQRDARAAVDAICARGAAPILVGGSGLYVNSVLYDFRFPGSDARVRETLNDRLARDGLAPLVAELCAADPHAAETVDLNNPRRVVRALEVLRVTGEPMAAALPRRPEPVRPTFVIGVQEERAALVARLDRRVEDMWRRGIVAEAAALVPRGIRRSVTASRAIGYAQALAELAGELTTAEAIAATQQLTRRYARRQVSWFRRLPEVTWVTTAETGDPAVLDGIVSGWLALAGASGESGESAPSAAAPAVSPRPDTAASATRVASAQQPITAHTQTTGAPDAHH